MNKLKFLLIAITISLLPNISFACDESCKREEAEKTHNIEFPGYLSWDYCEGLRRDFITVDMRSWQSYSSKHFDTKFKGPIKNMVNTINQRKDWLSECDGYMSLTTGKHIFNDKQTTESIFAALDKVRSELTAVIDGVRYSSEHGDETPKIVAERFEKLFTVVDDHNNLMHLRGHYVYQ